MIHKIKSLTIGHTNRNKDQQCPLIRPLHKTDIPNIVSRYSFPWTTPEKTKTLWKIYYQEQKDKVRTVAVIEKDDEILKGSSQGKYWLGYDQNRPLSSDKPFNNPDGEPIHPDDRAMGKYL